MRRNEVKHIMSERNVLLQNVKHPFLVGLHYSFQTPDKLYFVLDYVNGGEVCIYFSCREVQRLHNVCTDWLTNQDHFCTNDADNDDVN